MSPVIGRGALAIRAVTLAVAFLAPALAAAQSAIDGTLRNGTTGGPGSASRVNLIWLGGGMSQVGSIESVTGTFHFDLDAPGPYLVQAQYGGVTYNMPIPPMERGIATPEITVYETTTDTTAIAVTIPHWIVIVDGPKLHVSRVFEVANTTAPPRSIVGDPGALRFDVPDAASAVQGNITSARMPIRQDPVETRDGRGKTMLYGLRPGTTRYEVEYELDYRGEVELKETLYHGAKSIQVIVLPADVTVESGELEPQGRSERQGVSFLTFTGADLPAGKTVALRIKGDAVAPRVPDGAGAAAPAAGAPLGAGAAEAPALRGEPGEVEVEAVRGARKWLVLAGTGLLLLGGLVTAIRKPPPRRDATGEPRRKLTPRAESMLDELARLDEDLVSGRLAEAEHREQRAVVKRRLVEELGARRRKKTA